MKKSFVSLIVTLTALQFANAQLGSADAAAANAANPNAAATNANNNKSAADSVVIVNQTQTASQGTAQAVEQLQKQPVTVVQAAPLSLSKAEELRKAREQVELDTEQKIAEKLENSRLEDERKRQDAIMININAVSAAAASASVVKVEKVEEAPPVPTHPIATPPIVVAPPIAETKPPVARISDDAKKALAVRDIRNDDFASFSFGMLDYDSYDVETFGALGVSLGRVFPSNFMLALDFAYSNNTISRDVFLYRTMDQFNLGASGRYVFMRNSGSSIRPNIGGVMQYVYRDYSELQDPNGAPVPTYGGDMASDAIDWGFVAGVDFRVSHQFTLGFEYRYLTNLTYKIRNNEFANTSAFRNGPYDGYFEEPLEARSYSIWSGVIRYTF